MQFVAENQAVLILAALAVLAVLVGIALLRRPGQGAADRVATVEAERETLRAALDEARIACARLEAGRDALETRIAALDEDLAAEAACLSYRERDISALKIAETRLTGDCDNLKNESRKLVDAYEKLEEKQRLATEAVQERDRRIADLNGTVQGLTATLRAEREKHAALLEETERTRAQLVAQFKAISGEIMQTQGKATTEAQKSELEKIILPFRAEIEGLKGNLKDITDKAEKERQGLGTQLLLMQTKAAELAEEANGLARALRGDTKKQGNWGETILERILEAAGLVEGTHFTRQASMRNEDGNRLIPDVVLHLPGARDVVIDSKVTLIAYQDMVQAADAEAEAAALKRHVQAVRAHIRVLSDKDYGGAGSLGRVMMFLPVEGALSAALTADAGLVIDAAEKRVHLMTPTTLMPVLQIVDHLWTVESRNRNVEDIFDRAGKLHDKFVAVIESLQKVGDHLRKASDCHDDAMKQMSEGRGNVLRQVEQLKSLRAKTRKTLPSELLAASDEDDEAEEASPAPALTAG